MALVGALRTFGAPAPLTLGVRHHMHRPNLPKLASHDLLVLLVVTGWTFVVLLFSVEPRGDSFISIVEITRTFYPLVDELATCFGPSSSTVYNYMLWIPIAPIFFLIAIRSSSISKAVAEHKPSWPQFFGAIALLVAFFCFFPPDTSCTRHESRTASFLFSGRIKSIVVAGLVTYLMSSLLAYAALIIRSMSRKSFDSSANRT